MLCRRFHFSVEHMCNLHLLSDIPSNRLGNIYYIRDHEMPVFIELLTVENRV